MKDFLLHKLTLRVAYIIAAFATSHVVALITSSQVQAYLPKIGVTVQITDPAKLEAWITGLMLIGGEFVYRWIHTKFILPTVSKPQGETK